MNKIYAVVYNAYEFDDLSYGDPGLKFLSFEKDKCIEKFNTWKAEEIEKLNNAILLNKEWLEEHPEFKEDYQIVTNTDDVFEMYCGNWCYYYALIEYELNTVL